MAKTVGGEQNMINAYQSVRSHTNEKLMEVAKRAFSMGQHGPMLVCPHVLMFAHLDASLALKKSFRTHLSSPETGPI